MKYTVWKYSLKVGRTYVEMPSESVVVHCHEQDGEVCIWAGVIPDSPKRGRVFEVIGTGEQRTQSELYQYIGTAHMANGLVWHVFEVLGN